MFFSRLYSLYRSRQVMHTSYQLYKKKGKILSTGTREVLEQDLKQLDAALQEENREKADELARKLELFNKTHFKKSLFTYTWELIAALAFALVIATVVRMMWFELYEIPTGSMRPTFKEQDHLTVTKLAFGINIPLMTEHFYFDPDLVQRTSVVIFTGDKIPFIDSKTNFLYLFPYTKRYIKRLIGKPGDSIYFYGGKIYAIDKEGNALKEFLDSPWMDHLEHIPFLTFEGRPAAGTANQVLFYQMNMPVGRLAISSSGTMEGEVFNGKKWVKDQLTVEQDGQDQIHTYSDLFGMRNYGMVRLLTKEQLDQQDLGIKNEELGDGVLYLEIRHNPSLSYPAPKFYQEARGYGLTLSPYVSIIPLQQKHLDALMEHMYTARFVVQDGYAKRYSLEEPQHRSTQLRFQGVPDGTYEFYFGKAVSVGFGGITTSLPDDHPLYKHSLENIQRLFNNGIDFNTAYQPRPKGQGIFPQRYAYFRDGDLYMLGAPIIKKDDPVLVEFNKNEEKRVQEAAKNKPYVAFKDYGAPVKEDGSYNNDFIKSFGVKIPDHHYMVLGDNHAMSSDSRVFGLIPEQNLQGAPSLIIWPPGNMGRPLQKPYPIFTLPRIIVWSIALAIFAIWYAFHYRKKHTPIF